MGDYPHSDKLADRSGDHDVIIEFLEFCHSKGIHLSRTGMDLLSSSEEPLILAFFGVDPKELERERKAMLSEYRKEASHA
jgi:hypothetical protein